MNDPELKAIGEITRALDGITEEHQRRNVLLYINARYGGALPRMSGPAVTATAEDNQPKQYASIGELFDAISPGTEADRVLAVAYWIQVVEGVEDFESFPVNRHLKNLGHPVSNITRALDSMIAQTPRLILQISKSGRSKQARKRYKITREGIKRVQVLVSQPNGEKHED